MGNDMKCIIMQDVIAYDHNTEICRRKVEAIVSGCEVEERIVEFKVCVYVCMYV